MNLPEVSVVVPTYNRRASLLRLLESLDRQTLDPERFEVVVVDNNSTDGTDEETLRFAARSRAKVRHLSERSQGTAYARNRGIRESVAPVVAFTDDDVEADFRWLDEILRGLDAHRADAVGGRALPVWPGPLPEWWLPTYEHVFVRNWGNEPCPVDRFPFFYGQNLAIRRRILESVGGFDPRLGPRGCRYIAGEDAELCRRIHDHGGLLYYLPTALVHHYVGADRFTRSYFRRRYYGRGVSYARQRAMAGRPMEIPYQLKLIVTALRDWTMARSAAVRFHAELSARMRLAYVVEAVTIRFRNTRRVS